MKLVISLLVSSALLAIAPNTSSSQNVSVSGALIGNGSYATLSSAFSAINSGAQTSANIIVVITGNTSEPSTGADLNNGAWSSIVIQPDAASRIISGAITAGNPLIDFNGADNVTIDGLFSEEYALTIENTTVSSNTNTSTIRFQSDAVNNHITRCVIKGSSTTGLGSNGGNIIFGTGTTTGNDNNRITNCDIGPAGANLPTKCIFFTGTTTTETRNNSGDTIRNCNIYDYFSGTTSSAGIYVEAGTTNTIVKDNKFFQTTAKVLTTNSLHAAINIENTKGNNYQLIGNKIGGSGSSGTGIYTISGASNNFRAISLNVDTVTASSVQGNLIDGISLTTAASGSSFSTPCALIYIENGLVNTGTEIGNVIGSLTESGRIVFSSSSTNPSHIIGISNFGVSNWKCSNNSIGGIVVSNTSTGASNFYGIVANMTSSDTIEIEYNCIGGVDSASVLSTTTSNSSQVVGILCNNPPGSIAGNRVRNLMASGGNSTNEFASVIGISVRNSTTAASLIITSNNISRLRNTDSLTSSVISGIYNGASTGTNSISGNLITLLLAKSFTATINGLLTEGGTTTFSNNMISLGEGLSSLDLSFSLKINGFNEINGSNKFYFNSVYIGGNSSNTNSPSANTYAFFSATTNSSRYFKNNIFYNSRYTLNGKNYSIKVAGQTPNPLGLNLNSNLYFFDEESGYLGNFNNIDYSDLGDWTNATGQDYSSLFGDPQFVDPSNHFDSTVNMHINSLLTTFAESQGALIPDILEDFDHQVRSTLSPVDIGADAGNFSGYGQINFINVSGASAIDGNYSTLSAACAAVNSADQSGRSIVLKIRSNTFEPISGAILNHGNWVSLNIVPDGGSSRLISGSTSFSASIPLLHLNGADKVTIDGLNTGGNSLTFSNSTSNTLKFRSDASDNIVKNCNIYGQKGASASGTILFDGNNNLISDCDIGPFNSHTPICLNILNGSNLTVEKCNIFDYYDPDNANSYGLFVDECSNLTIRENKFYQTIEIFDSSSLSGRHSAINISCQSAASSNINISDNYIGHSSSSGNGKYTMDVEINEVIGIYVYAPSTSLVSIQGNTISGFALLHNYDFYGIYVDYGIANVGDESPNIIGSLTDTNSISSFGSVYGISNSSVSPFVCTQNQIGGIQINNGIGDFYGISVEIGQNVLVECSENIVGGDFSGSVFLSDEDHGFCRGIFISGPSANVSGNLVSNLTTKGIFAGSTGSLEGISLNNSSSTRNFNVRDNTIHSLLDLSTNRSLTINGMYCRSNGTSNLIERNLIHSLMSSSWYTKVSGIRIGSNTLGSIQNNFVRLGMDANGNSMNFGSEINGIEYLLGSEECNFYHNSIYIGGMAKHGYENSYAFNSTVTNQARNIVNNIFLNARSNYGSTGKHYAIRLGGTTPNPAGLNIDNNVYFTPSPDGILGFYNGSDVTTLQEWQAFVGQDTNSFNTDPNFVNPDGDVLTIDLHINPDYPSVINGNGGYISSVTDDIDGQLRSDLTPVDIGADAGDFPAFFTYDVKLSDATIQNQVIVYGNSFEIDVEIVNFGSASLSSIPLHYSVDGGSPVGPVYTEGVLPYLGTTTIVFSDSNSFYPASPGTHTLKVYSTLSSDQFRQNDTVTLVVDVKQKISTFPFVETFSNLSNWSVTYENPIYETVLWELGLCTNPAGDLSNIAATSNCYLGATGRREILKSPPIDFSVGTNADGSNIPVLDFYVSYSGYSGLDDSLEVLLSTDNGNSFFNAAAVYIKSQTSDPSLATRPVQYTEFFPDSSIQWRHEQISLENVAGDTNVIIGFRSKSDFGNRIWIDNIIVSVASSIAPTAVNSAGSYTFDDVTVQVTSVSLDSFDKIFLRNDRPSDIAKTPPDRSRIVSSIPGANGNPNVLLGESVDNISGGVLTLTRYPFQDPVPSFATPSISENDINTGAITGDSSRFTPDFVNPDIYFTVSYSGNDYNGYAEYNIKIDVSDLTSISDLNKVYIMKRADLTDQWECLSTTVSGDTLIAYGLGTFSDFSIGQMSDLSITLNLNLFIEGFYNASVNQQVGDTVRVYLRNTVSPFAIVDSSITFISGSGTGTCQFTSAQGGTYYIAVKHRNAVETWSAAGVFLSGNVTGYDFTANPSSAFGNNLIQIDTSPIRFAFFSGDADGDGAVDATDLSLIDNDAYNFNSGYIRTDINGDNFIDGTDYSIADNNSLNFVGKITPEILR